MLSTDGFPSGARLCAPNGVADKVLASKAKRLSAQALSHELSGPTLQPTCSGRKDANFESQPGACLATRVPFWDMPKWGRFCGGKGKPCLSGETDKENLTESIPQTGDDWHDSIIALGW